MPEKRTSRFPSRSRHGGAVFVAVAVWVAIACLLASASCGGAA